MILSFFCERGLIIERGRNNKGEREREDGDDDGECVRL